MVIMPPPFLSPFSPPPPPPLPPHHYYHHYHCHHHHHCHRFQVAELQKELTARGLPTKGNKDELAGRLTDSVHGDGGGGGGNHHSLVVGAKVTARYKGHEDSQRNRFYPGTIRSVNPNDTYDIDYDDGEREANVARDLIKVVMVPATDSNASRSALASEMFRARLVSSEAKMLAYHAHLVRDRNQGRFKVGTIIRARVRLRLRVRVRLRFRYS